MAGPFWQYDSDNTLLAFRKLHASTKENKFWRRPILLLFISGYFVLQKSHPPPGLHTSNEPRLPDRCECRLPHACWKAVERWRKQTGVMLNASDTDPWATSWAMHKLSNAQMGYSWEIEQICFLKKNNLVYKIAICYKKLVTLSNRKKSVAFFPWKSTLGSRTFPLNPRYQGVIATGSSLTVEMKSWWTRQRCPAFLVYGYAAMSLWTFGSKWSSPAPHLARQKGEWAPTPTQHQAEVGDQIARVVVWYAGGPARANPIRAIDQDHGDDGTVETSFAKISQENKTSFEDLWLLFAMMGLDGLMTESKNQKSVFRMFIIEISKRRHL